MTSVLSPVAQQKHWRWKALWTAAITIAVLVSTIVVVAVGSITTVPMSGVPTSDVRVAWLLPATRLVADAAAALTVGCCLAACLLPGAGRGISLPGARWLRLATSSAAAWAAAAVAALPGMFVEFLNTDLGNVSVQALGSFLVSVPEGTAQGAVILLAALVAVSSRSVLTVVGARTLLLLSLLAGIPGNVVEHLEGEGSRYEVAVATTAGVLHVAGALTWSGALAALVLLRRLTANDLVAAVTRYSRLAPVLVLIVGASGLLNGGLELQAPQQLGSTAYGRLIILKALAFTALLTVGWWHRQRTLVALTAGHPNAFRRAAAVEVLIFAATLGLAVGLSRTPEPAASAADRTEPVVSMAGAHPSSQWAAASRPDRPAARCVLLLTTGTSLGGKAGSGN